MGLLDIAVLMRNASLVSGRLHAIMRHQGGIARGKVLASVLVKLMHGGGKVVGAMLERHPTKLPEARLDPFGQRLEALREADLHGFDVGVGQDQMVEQVREGLVGQRDAKVGHMREVGLGAHSGVMDLGEDHRTVGAIKGAPVSNMALERAKLALLIAAGVLLTQGGEERVGLEGGVALHLLLDPGPVSRKWIRAGAVGARLLELTGQGTLALVFACGVGMHTCAGGSLFLCFAFAAFTEHDLHLGIRLHRCPPLRAPCYKTVRANPP